MSHQRLPHIDLPDIYQFITFRTHDSMDIFLQKLASSHNNNSRKQLQMDEYLDQSARGAYLVDGLLLYFCQFLQDHDGRWYELAAFAVMPNHVHLLVKPLLPVPEMMRLLKGASSRVINETRGVCGRFWAKDYFDRGIRDERHFWVVYRYIRNNPLTLPRADVGERFYGVYGNVV